MMGYWLVLENHLFKLLKYVCKNKIIIKFISLFHSAVESSSSRRLRYITVNYSKIIINITKLLYQEGVIRLYILKDTKILIYFNFLKVVIYSNIKLYQNQVKGYIDR